MEYKFRLSEIALIKAQDEWLCYDRVPFLPSINDEVEILAYAIAQHLQTGERLAAYEIRHIKSGRITFYREPFLKKRPYEGDGPGSWDNCVWKPKVTVDVN